MAAAVFASVAVAADVHTITVRTHGAGTGVVSSQPAGIDCGAICTHSFEEGTVVTFTATPDPGFVFAGWDGVCAGLGSCELLVDMAHDVGATFSLAQSHPLAVKLHGSGSGVVTSDPAGIDCGATCLHQFEPGALVTLSAVADPGMVFTGWTGICNSAVLICQVLMDSAHDVSATFEPAPTRLLTVRSEGGGSVSSDPAGLSCASTCARRFAEGAVVTLTATPEAGFAFGGWGGACSGTGVCKATMDEAHDVSARFQQTPTPGPTPPPKTSITRAVIDARQGRATFHFQATGNPTRFQCSLRPRPKPPVFGNCRSPRSYRGLGSGRYLFAVRAIGPGGTDPTPAKHALRIP